MVNVDLRKSWTTHMGMLVKVLYMSRGDVIELGAGPFSTPLLHWVCKDMNRRLVSFENNPEFYAYAKQFQSALHRIVLVKSWDEVDSTIPRGMVFVDHGPSERRVVDAIRFKDSADYVVVHDTNWDPDFPDIERHFAHVYTWKACRPWVTIASNIKKLTAFDL